MINRIQANPTSDEGGFYCGEKDSDADRIRLLAEDKEVRGKDAEGAMTQFKAGTPVLLISLYIENTPFSVRIMKTKPFGFISFTAATRSVGLG